MRTRTEPPGPALHSVSGGPRAQPRAGDRGSGSCDTAAVTAPTGAFQGRGDGRRKTRLHAKRVLLPLSLRLLRTSSLFHCINAQLKPQPRLDLKPVLVQRPRFPRNRGSRTVLVLVLLNLDDKEIFPGKDFLSLYAFFIKIVRYILRSFPAGSPGSPALPTAKQPHLRQAPERPSRALPAQSGPPPQPWAMGRCPAGGWLPTALPLPSTPLPRSHTPQPSLLKTNKLLFDQTHAIPRTDTRPGAPEHTRTHDPKLLLLKTLPGPGRSQQSPHGPGDAATSSWHGETSTWHLVFPCSAGES